MAAKANARMLDGLLKVLATYILAIVLAVAPLMLMSLTFDRGFDGFLGDLRIAILMAATLMLLPFVLVGLPYLAFGYPGWGRDHPALFCVGGAIFGMVAASGTLALFTSQWSPSPFDFLGALVGAGCSWLWHMLSRKLDQPSYA